MNIGSNINLFDGELEQGSINGETGANATSSSIIRTKNYITIPNGVEKLRIIRTKVGSSSYAIGLRFYDSSQTYLSAATYNYKYNYIDIDIINNAKYLRFVDLSNDLTNKYKVTTDLGSCGYTPTNIGGIDYEVKNKSIFGGYLYTATSGNVTYTTNPDGTVLANGTASGTSLSLSSTTAIANGYTRILKAGSYKLSGGTSKNSVQIISTIGTSIANTGTSTNIKTFTLEQDTECFIRIQGKSGETFTNYVVYPMCTKSDLPENYVSYKDCIHTIPLPTGMEFCKLGTYKDYPYKKDGRWYKHKEIGKVVLTGDNEGWSISGTGTANWFYQSGNVLISSPANTTEVVRQNDLCNRYMYAQITTGNTDTGFWVLTNQIRIRYGTEDTIENFTTWLSNNNVIVYYILANSVEEEITDKDTIYYLEHFPIYKEYTNIECINDVKPDMHIDYLYDNEVNNYWGKELDSLAEKLHDLQNS